MNSPKTMRSAIIGIVLITIVTVARAADNSAGVVLAPPSVEVVRATVNQWVAAQGNISRETREDIAALWKFDEQQPDADELLNRAVATFSLVDDRTKALVDSCRFQNAPISPPDADLLSDAGLHPFHAANLRLYYGRYLTQRRMYEEGLEVLKPVDVNQVIDPASLLFFTAVCQHHLLMKEEGLRTIEQLTTRTERVPSRYATIAELMQYDLQALKSKSLDEISRKMSDVERRLQLGRSGQKVQKVEDEIIAGLDEIIKKIEQQNSPSGGGGGNNGGALNPADVSQVKGSKAPGDVDDKKIKSGGKWGKVPDKVRARVRQLLRRDFPGHYRRVVEEYFRKAAKRTAP